LISLSSLAYSFLAESRRLDNARLKQRLGAVLRYPRAQEALKHEPARTH
jgi:hypothetical protein